MFLSQFEVIFLNTLEMICPRERELIVNDIWLTIEKVGQDWQALWNVNFPHPPPRLTIVEAGQDWCTQWIVNPPPPGLTQKLLSHCDHTLGTLNSLIVWSVERMGHRDPAIWWTMCRVQTFPCREGVCPRKTITMTTNKVFPLMSCGTMYVHGDIQQPYVLSSLCRRLEVGFPDGEINFYCLLKVHSLKDSVKNRDNVLFVSMVKCILQECCHLLSSAILILFWAAYLIWQATRIGKTSHNDDNGKNNLY